MNQPLPTNNYSPKRLTAAPRNMAIQAIGRDADVEKIFDKLMQSALPLVITGVGGLGKTTVVQLISHKYENQFDHVAYLSADAFYSDNKAREADNAELFLNAFVNNKILTTKLGVAFDPTDDTLTRFQIVIDALSCIEGNNLLVIDNVSAAATAYFDYLSVLVDWKILLTSRDALPNMTHYKLGTLSPDDAVTLFNRIYQQTIPKAELTKILRGLNYHTLAIELIAAYAREKNSPIAALEKELQERDLRQLDDYHVTSIRDGKGQTVIEHLVRTFLMEFDEKEAEIMRYFSVLPAEGTELVEILMSEEALSYYFQKRDEQADLHNTLDSLVRLNWLVKRNKAYLCHPVVKEMAYLQLKPDAINCEKLIRAFNNILNVDPNSNDHILNYKHFEPLVVEILRGCYDANKKSKITDNILAILANRLNKFYLENSNYFMALKYGEINFVINAAIFDADDEQVALAHSNLAVNYSKLNNLTMAIAEIEKAIAIEETKLDPLNIKLATSYSNLAMIYLDLGDSLKAKVEMDKAIVIFKAKLDPQHLNLATSYSNLAMIYRDLGEFLKAKDEMEKAIGIQNLKLDPQHLEIATSYLNLGLIYRDLGDLQNAKTKMKKSIAIQEVKLDPLHLKLATAYSNLAIIYQDLGDFLNARTELEKAIAIEEVQSDLQHSSLATHYSNLAIIYQDLGDLPRAKTEMEKAIAIEEAQLDPQPLSLATSYNNLAYILADMQVLPLAKTYMDKAVTIRQLRLPPEHPYLLGSLKTQQAWAEILRGGVD